MSEGQINYSEDMLSKTLEISGWVEQLSTCVESVSNIMTALPDAYNGQASESLDIYYNALNSHLSSLLMFYSVAIEYSVNCYLEMMGLDMTMSQLMNLGAGGAPSGGGNPSGGNDSSGGESGESGDAPQSNSGSAPANDAPPSAAAPDSPPNATAPDHSESHLSDKISESLPPAVSPTAPETSNLNGGDGGANESGIVPGEPDSANGGDGDAPGNAENLRERRSMHGRRNHSRRENHVFKGRRKPS